jgi:hypothetical protein
MESEAAISQILRELAQQLPSLITALVCIAVLLTRWKRHQKVSLLAVLGLSFLLLHAFVFTLIYVWVPAMLIKSTYNADDIRSVYLVLGLIFNFARVIAFAPLLAAVFIGRPV